MFLTPVPYVPGIAMGVSDGGGPRLGAEQRQRARATTTDNLIGIISYFVIVAI
jgi:hypothetical protein